MALAVVRSIDAPRRLASARDEADYEQDLVDQYLLASMGAGCRDSTLANDRSVIFEFARFLGRPVWTACAPDADRYLTHQRKVLGRSYSTVHGKALALGNFFDFLVIRHQGDIHALTGRVVAQVIDEFNRPASPDYGSAPVPPGDDDVEALFSLWRQELPNARKYLVAVRDYVVASLWRRIGLRIMESYMLDIRDWRRDLGDYGNVHVRFGKGSRGRGYKTRLVPAINSVRELLDWWMVDIRHQFGDDYTRLDAPMFPSERRPDAVTGLCRRAGDQVLREGLNRAVSRWLPQWAGRLTPHVLRHFCASSLYRRGMDLKAIQELLGHSWLSTTTHYIHVPAEHIENAWEQTNSRTATRLGLTVR
ncbi:tyrosine-type recombinase/integrase [Catelliglobosispora koreensis]|uniref:tyrosine-type recombinase/integrase n=1 Tax=Catelliglobosispora koreensis TaxID=129052 RepID=UPI00039F0379|nr:tyrosine-type recombinase/integrase [Catelliglobosispora koreensis]